MATRSPPSDPLKLDRSDGSATLDLYRAVLGPMRRDYYLHAFTRFDAAGKAGLSWNWAAALVTLNWMLFRQLWSTALAYVGAITAALLLLFGIGRLLFGLSDASQWGLGALALLTAVALPGALGNAWLYAACNRKMETALRDSATLEEACNRLARGASGSARMASMAGANLALLAALVAGALSWPEGGMAGLRASAQSHLGAAIPTEGLATPAQPSASDALPVSALAATSVAAAAAATASASATAPAAPASAAAFAAAPLASASASPMLPLPTAAASAPQPAASGPPVGASAVAAPLASATATASQPALATTAAKVKAPSKPSTASAKRSHNAKAIAKPDSKHAAASSRTAAKHSTKTSQLASVKSAPTQATKATAKPSGAAPAPAADGTAAVAEPYVLNIGLFADENNARNAYTKLKDAGLPAQTQAMQFPKGPRTRVRVGPFATQAEAERAAEQVRALKLDAVLGKP